MQEAKAKHGAQQVGRGHLEVLLKAAVVVKTLVDHADGDDGVYRVEVPGDFVEGGEDERDAVPPR